MSLHVPLKHSDELQEAGWTRCFTAMGKPVEQMPPMTTLDLTASLTNGDRTLPLGLQAVALLIKEDIGQHDQRPEVHGCRGTISS